MLHKELILRMKTHLNKLNKGQMYASYLMRSSFKYWFLVLLEKKDLFPRG